jgi:hypothetical protein
MDRSHDTAGSTHFRLWCGALCPYAPLPYGIAPNRQTLEELIQYALEQRIIARPVTVEELFPPNTHELLG